MNERILIGLAEELLEIHAEDQSGDLYHDAVKFLMTDGKLHHIPS